MTHATTTKQVRRTPRKKMVAATLAVLLSFAAVGLGAAPANASDTRCAANQVGINCGIIYNTSSVNIRIGTNFSPTISSGVGTVTGVTATLNAYRNSNVFKDSSGRFYDWDAVYVGPKSCLFIKVGPGLGSSTSYRNTGTAGVWFKVNNLGGNVTGLRAC